MDKVTVENMLSVSRKRDLEELIDFLKNQVLVHAEVKSQECVVCIDQAIDILEKFGQGDSKDGRGVILISRLEDELGYNSFQLKVSNQEIEIAHIIQFLCPNGQEKKRDRLFYLDSQGYCENFIGAWNGIGQVLIEMNSFLQANNWKLSTG